MPVFGPINIITVFVLQQISQEHAFKMYTNGIENLAMVSHLSYRVKKKNQNKKARFERNAQNH